MRISTVSAESVIVIERRAPTVPRLITDNALTCRNGHTVSLMFENDRQTVYQAQFDPVGCNACRELLAVGSEDDARSSG